MTSHLLLAKQILAVPIGQESRLTGNAGVIPQTFFLTITNPGALLGIFAILAGVSSAVGGLATYTRAFILMISIMGRGVLWWMGLAWLIATIRHRLNEKRLRVIDQIAGLVLIGFGLLLIAKTAVETV